jgi:hypothetical protein
MNMSSAARLAANRTNAQASTGPRTPEGRAASAANARRHGLTGAFTVLAHEDLAEFRSLLDQYRAEFAPASAHEEFLVEEMAQSRWTLARSRRIQTHVLNQVAGAEPESDNPDARLAACIVSKSPNPIAAAERYVGAAERAYFRAHRELIQARERQERNEANEADKWLEQELLRTPVPRFLPSDLLSQWPPEQPEQPEIAELRATPERPVPAVLTKAANG